MARVTVLGAGLVGRAIVYDLSRTCEVTAVDASKAALDHVAALPRVRTITADLAEPEVVGDLVAGADLVISAVPGHLGYRILAAIIQASRSVVDISFFPEDALSLDALARERGVPAIVDCGVAPGMSHMVAGAATREMAIERYTCHVGGLPKARTSFAEYKAPFSPRDVIEEYTRPARFVSAGQVVTAPALSDLELVDIAPVGQLEAFNTDGLRTLIETMKIPEMREKTLRYPGHAAAIQSLKREGAFSDERIAKTCAWLFREWALVPGEPEFTVMRVSMSGRADGVRQTIVYDLYDETDPATGLSSMARTTGFTATATAHLLLEGRLTRPGIWPPECIGMEPGALDRILAYQRERGIEYRRTERTDPA
jgi:saccharopine dehydrogenase-like NADP-dependent oxidoreductase